MAPGVFTKDQWGPNVIATELGADCQAGMFIAVEEARYHLPPEVFASLLAIECEVGAIRSTKLYGTCGQQQAAFQRGYAAGKANLGALCTGNALDLARTLCQDASAAAAGVQPSE